MKRIPVSALIVGFIAPAAITLAVIAVGLTWLGDLPASMAIHWTGAGEPDGFGTPLGFLLQLGGTSLALAALLTGIVVASAESGLAVKQKVLLLISPLITIMLMTVTLVSLYTQRSAVDAAAAPSPVGALIPGVALGLVAAVIGWFLLPKARPAEDQDATTPAPRELSPTARVMWTRSVSSPRWLIALVLGTAVLIIVPAIVSGGPSLWFWSLTIPAAALLLGTLVWRVRIDNGGVLVRSFAGLPRFRVKLADIDSATVPVVNPLVEFGGWGIRFGGGRRMGVILNGGDALEVHRVNGSSLVVTVRDAVGAASLINGLVARARLGA